MHAYHELVRDVLEDGSLEATGARWPDQSEALAWTTFQRTIRHDMEEGFPLLTTKKVNFPLVASELAFFTRGYDNVSFLHAHGNHIWDPWAREDGGLGPVYGAQWRKYRGIGPDGDPVVQDQLLDAVWAIVGALSHGGRSRRRAVVVAWNPAQNLAMVLPPCHYAFQLVLAGGRLNLAATMRSCDVFVGLPFNLASYALLLAVVCRAISGYRLEPIEPGEVAITMGDCHVYDRHRDACDELLSRAPRTLPSIVIDDSVGAGPAINKTLCFDPTKVGVEGYDPHPFIKVEVAV